MSENRLTATDYRKMASRSRRKGEQRYKQKLKKMAGLGWTVSGAGKYTKTGEWARCEEDVCYCKRVWRRENRARFIKSQCNRAVRNSNEETLYQRGEYKKLDDFDWKYI